MDLPIKNGDFPQLWDSLLEGRLHSLYSPPLELGQPGSECLALRRGLEE